jgi:hypothetical protein
MELACPYFEPSFQALCRRGFKDGLGSNTPSFKNFALGYTAVEANRHSWAGPGQVAYQTSTRYA